MTLRRQRAAAGRSCFAFISIRECKERFNLLGKRAGRARHAQATLQFLIRPSAQNCPTREALMRLKQLLVDQRAKIEVFCRDRRQTFFQAARRYRQFALRSRQLRASKKILRPGTHFNGLANRVAIVRHIDSARGNAQVKRHAITRERHPRKRHERAVRIFRNLCRR